MSLATVERSASGPATRVRYAYDSLTSPHAVFEADIATGARTLLRQESVPTYEADRYASEYPHDGATPPPTF